MLLKSASEGQTGEVVFHSSDSLATAQRPLLVVTYLEDVIPPVVSELSVGPGTGGGTLMGTVTINAQVTDAATGVSRVEFYINGGLRGTVAAEPYTLDWDTTGYPDGIHHLLVRAYDRAGNCGSSSRAVLFSDGFGATTWVDSEETTANVDTARGVVNLAAAVDPVGVQGASASSSYVPPDHSVGRVRDGNLGTRWRSAEKTVANATEVLTLDWGTWHQIAELQITPGDPKDRLLVRVELLGANDQVVWATDYRVLDQSPSYIATANTSARKARLTFTNLAPDPFTGLYHADVAEIRVVRHYLAPQTYYVQEYWLQGYSWAAGVRGTSAVGSAYHVGYHDAYVAWIWPGSVSPSDASAWPWVSPPYVGAAFSGGSYNNTQYGTLITTHYHPDTSVHRLYWTDWDYKYGDSSSPSGWYGMAWVQTNFAARYTDCWVESWGWGETRPLTRYVYILRGVRDYSAILEYEGYRAYTYWYSCWEPVSYTPAAGSTYAATFGADRAIDGNRYTAWVSSPQPESYIAEPGSRPYLEVALTAPSVVNAVHVVPRFAGLQGELLTRDLASGDWVVRTTLTGLTTGTYGFSETETDGVRLRFSHLHTWRGAHYAGIDELQLQLIDTGSPAAVLASTVMQLAAPVAQLELEVSEHVPQGTASPTRPWWMATTGSPSCRDSPWFLPSPDSSWRCGPRCRLASPV